MEVAVVSALMTNIVGKILTVLEKRYEQLTGLEVDIDYMRSELSMIAGDMEDHLSQKAHLTRVQSASFTLMRDLAFDIEDCLDRFLPCGACDCEGEPASIGNENQVDFVDEIQKLKKRLEGAHEQKTNYGVKGGQQQASAVDASGRLFVDDACIFEDVPVGIEKPKQELLDLLKGERERLMVISIVGFGGSGKTALANQVYHCPQVHRDFGCRAWAVASKHKDDAKGLLTAILQQLLPSAPPAVLQTNQASKIQELLRKHLQVARTRCLIVIDDIEKRQWEGIKPIFSALKAVTLLVTTTVQSVANACSSGYGYVYSMRTLSTEDSKTLLKNKVSFFQNSSPDSEDGSEAIVHTCLGHPLALLSVANHLLDEKQLTGEICKELHLGLRMEENKNDNFTKLRQVLMNNYSSLPAGSSLKTCLLYTSLFPNDRPVSRKTLTRRWLAEGYIESQQPRSDLEAAEENFKELTDRNIILPVDTSNNGKAKTCRPHGIMHQFMLHRSMSSNFIATSFGAKNRSNYRHLVIENRLNGTASSTDHGTAPAVRSGGKLNKIRTSLKEMVVSAGSVNKMRHRSLTVFGSAGEDVYSYLTNCKLLRVLDLKESNDFKDEHLQKIYELLHLKYLTLGSSVSHLPVKMKGLHCLGTLDLRKTKIETLPLEIISLPHLAHLFGKIKLKRVSVKNREDISLQTLAGVVVDTNSGFPELMAHMKRLTKVKIWCESNSTGCSYAVLSEAIHKFAQDGMSTPVGARSLSLHLNDFSKDLLNHHQGDNTMAASRNPGYLSSLKLQGSLNQFPQFVMSLRGLKELCLTYTNLTGADLLLGLRKLRHLVFLKLVEVHLAGLAIDDGDLPSLQRLCLVVQQPRFPTIQQGALSRLTSIQLLCKGLEHLCGIKMEWFEDIQEIALDSMVNQETIKLWEDEAKKHPRRPRVCFLKRVVDPAETRPSVKYVASCQVEHNCYTDTCNTDHMAIDPEDLTLKHESEGQAKSELVTGGLDRLTLQIGPDQVQARSAAGSDVGETSSAR